MEENTNMRRMRITAKSGRFTKTVEFPVTADFEDFMRTVTRNEEDELHYDVSGSRNVGIQLTIYNYGEQF